MAIHQSVKAQREGYLVYWTVTDADHAKLRAKLGPLAKSVLAPERSLHTAIKAALEHLFPNRRGQLPILIRPLRGRNGYEAVREIRGDDQNRYESLVSVRVVTKGKSAEPQVSWWGPASAFASSRDVYDRIDHELKYLGRHKVARVLALTVEHVFGVPLRPKGSVYWLPPVGLATFKTAADAVDAACVGGASIHVVKMVLDADGCKAVTEAVTNDVLSAVASLQDGLDGKPDPKTVKAKSTQAKAIRKRLAEYQKLLGDPLKAVENSLASVEKILIVSQLAAASGS